MESPSVGYAKPIGPAFDQDLGRVKTLCNALNMRFKHAFTTKDNTGKIRVSNDDGKEFITEWLPMSQVMSQTIDYLITQMSETQGRDRAELLKIYGPDSEEDFLEREFKVRITYIDRTIRGEYRFTITTGEDGVTIDTIFYKSLIKNLVKNLLKDLENRPEGVKVSDAKRFYTEFVNDFFSLDRRYKGCLFVQVPFNNG